MTHLNPPPQKKKKKILACEEKATNTTQNKITSLRENKQTNNHFVSHLKTLIKKKKKI